VTREYWNDLSAFFRLTEHDLRKSLHGWLQPPPLLEQAVLVQGLMPFTSQRFQRWSRVPNQPECGLPDAVRYPDLSHCPWSSAEGLQPDNMAALTGIMLRCSSDAADDHWGRYLAGPEDANDILQPVSSEFVLATAGLSTASLEETASAWQSASVVEAMVEGWPRRVLDRTRAFFSESVSAPYFFWTCR
jgi:hypothetical protein